MNVTNTANKHTQLFISYKIINFFETMNITGDFLSKRAIQYSIMSQKKSIKYKGLVTKVLKVAAPMLPHSPM